MAKKKKTSSSKLIQENKILKDKIAAMRAVLWEWNNSSDCVWNYYRLKAVGETKKDYDFLLD
jgi:hypothetical protein